MKITPNSKKISVTYLISLTDVIFLLLIFLMLASNFVTQTGITVKLPGSSSANQLSVKALEVIYSNTQDVRINGIRMNIEGFQKALPAHFQSKEQNVRLLAAKTTPLEEVIGVMDIIRNAGFEKITIATEKKLP